MDTIFFFISNNIKIPRPLLSRLAFVPDGVSKSMADLKPKGLQLLLGHLRVGELQH